MKKIFLLLISVSLISSCQNDDFETQIDNDPPIELRTATNPAEIRDLSGIELNIRLAATSRYLSAHRSKNSADLVGNGRDQWQKWFILSDRYSSNGAFDLKTNSSPSNGSYLYIHDNWKYPSLMKTWAGASPQWYFHRVSGTDYYRIGLKKGSVYYYLSAVADSGGALCFEPQSSTNSKRQIWEIVPLEGFYLDRIDYDLGSGVIRNVEVSQIKNLPSVNSTSVNVNRTFTINEKYTEASTFSRTEGTKLGTNVSASISTGVPGISSGQISSSVSSEKSWTYSSGETKTKEFAITDQYSFVQGPYSTYTITVVGTKYTLDVDYYAVYKSKINGTTVRLKGKWNGVTVSDTKVVLKDNSGNVIDTRSVKATPVR